jgi:hypothetical protein
VYSKNRPRSIKAGAAVVKGNPMRTGPASGCLKLLESFLGSSERGQIVYSHHFILIFNDDAPDPLPLAIQKFNEVRDKIFFHPDYSAVSFFGDLVGPVPEHREIRDQFLSAKSIDARVADLHAVLSPSGVGAPVLPFYNSLHPGLVHIEHSILPLVRRLKAQHGEGLGLQASDETAVRAFLDERDVSHGDDETLTIRGLNEFSGCKKGTACSVQDRLLAIGYPEGSCGFHHLFFPVIYDNRLGAGRQTPNNVKKNGMATLKGIAGRHKRKKSLVALKALHSASAACSQDDRSH